MKIAIVGSRRRNSLKDRKIVFRLISRLIDRYKDQKVVIVSGGCLKGADSFAEEAAHVFSLETVIFPIDKSTPIEDRWEFTKRAYARNALIAAECDMVYALVSSDRTGGTENTIYYAKDLHKTVFCVGCDGETYVDRDEKNAADETGDAQSKVHP